MRFAGRASRRAAKIPSLQVRFARALNPPGKTPRTRTGRTFDFTIGISPSASHGGRGGAVPRHAFRLPGNPAQAGWKGKRRFSLAPACPA
ncbi:hypothetical protein CCR78_08045 [Rhodovulum imhoffii]|nr:hypothetical protein [Rhodovulum imhoffii]